MKPIIVVYPTTQLFDSLQSYLSMMTNILDMELLLDFAIRRHFQGRVFDLEQDPAFLPYVDSAQRFVDVSIANEAIELAAAGLNEYFVATNVDPRTIVEVRCCNKDIMIKLNGEQRHASDCVIEGVIAGAIPNLRFLALPRRNSDSTST